MQPFGFGIAGGQSLSSYLTTLTIVTVSDTVQTITATVRTAQQLYCTNNNGIYISTASRGYIEGDPAHYDADSLVAIGIDCFNAVRDL
jgi:hypothetical protein